MEHRSRDRDRVMTRDSERAVKSWRCGSPCRNIQQLPEVFEDRSLDGSQRASAVIQSVGIEGGSGHGENNPVT